MTSIRTAADEKAAMAIVSNGASMEVDAEAKPGNLHALRVQYRILTGCLRRRPRARVTRPDHRPQGIRHPDPRAEGSSVPDARRLRRLLGLCHEPEPNREVRHLRERVAQPRELERGRMGDMGYMGLVPPLLPLGKSPFGILLRLVLT